MAVKLRKRALKKKGNYSLYLDIVNNGLRQREFLKVRLIGDREKDKETLALAKNIAAQREVELLNDDLPANSKIRENIKLVDFFEKLILENFPDSKNHSTTLSKLKAFSQADVFLSKISVRWGNNFKNFLITQHKKNTAGLYFRIVRQVLSIAIDEKLIKENPLTKMEAIEREEVKKAYLTFEEIQALTDTHLEAHPEVKWAFLFSCFTGLRYSDVKKIQWADVSNGQIEFRQKKTSELNYLPLPKAALTILNEVKKYSFHSAEIFPLPCNVTTNANLKTWAALAGIKKNISFHNSRHTFAVLSLSRGVGIYTVQGLLGHKDLKSTQTYSRVLDSMKKQAVDLLPELEVK